MSTSDSSDSYWKVKHLFAAAMERTPGEREAFLRETCKDDPRLYEELFQMLAAHEQTAGVMSTRQPAEINSDQAKIAPESFIGTTIGPYKLLEVIGEGGMGVVYKAEQRSPIQRIVALKLIKLGMDTRQVIARFESERQALALMNHPNVAAVYDAGATETGRPYFVMEYVAGAPITIFCDRHRQTTRQRLELFLQACDAVQHAHTKAIIHRDLKPGNLLVTLQNDRPVVKVIDFGIAKATAQRLTEQTVFTETGQMVGTPEYMSPEQAELHPIDVDTRSDIYSLGVVLYELLAGALPFDAATLRQAAYAQIQAIIREAEPPRPSTRYSSMEGATAAKVAESRGTHPSSLQRELRGELEWIPLKAMRKDRTRRYHTAIELASDIHNYIQNRPLTAGPESAKYRFAKFVKRNKGPVIATTAIASVLIAGIIGTTIGFIGQSRQRAIADQQRAAAEQQRLAAEQQRAEAVRQTDIAQAVTDFQTRMFESADPDKLLGDKITVVQVMTSAAQELDGGSLKDQPGVEAAVRRTLGSTLTQLGRFADAEPNLLRSLELCRQSPAADQSNVADALAKLGELKRLQGDYDKAESLLRESLQLRRTASPSGDKATANTLDRLGAVLRDRGRFKEAHGICREALDLSQKCWPPDHAVIGQRLNNLAMVLERLGRLSDAEPLYRRAFEIARNTHPMNHPATTTAMSNYAGVLADLGRYAEAEPLLRQALAAERQTLPSTHPQIAFTLGNLALVVHRCGRSAEGEPLCREAIDIRRKSLPAGHPLIGESLGYLGLILVAQGKLDDAKLVMQESLEITRAALPPGHPKISERLSILAKVYIEKGAYGEAETLLREGLDIRRKALGADHRDVGMSLHNLALVLEREGKLSEAEIASRQALDIVQRAQPPGHPDIARNKMGLAAILRGEQELAEAESLLRDAVEINRAKLAPGNTEIGMSLSDLAWVLRLEGKYVDAARVAREAMVALEAATGTDHWLYACARAHLGRSLVELVQYKEAETELLEAERVLRRTAATRQSAYADSRAALADLYARWEKADPGHGYASKSEQWRSASSSTTLPTPGNPGTQPVAN
jgi:serine/threonine protein kinase/Flp pilus assembly protein TadD